MRAIAVIIIILGLASLVFGILFTTQSVTARQEVADSVAPLPLEQLDAQYDTVKAQYDQMRQAGAQPDAQYNYVAIQKTGLGLARANVGTANAILLYGLIDIIVDLGLALTGIYILRKCQSDS